MLKEALELAVDEESPRARVNKSDDVNIFLGSKASHCKSQEKPYICYIIIKEENLCILTGGSEKYYALFPFGLRVLGRTR